MIKEFALTFKEMDLRNWQIVLISLSVIVFPISFFISSKELDPKGLLSSMIQNSDNKK